MKYFIAFKIVLLSLLFPSKCENKGKLKVVSTDNVSGTIAKSRSYKMKPFPKAVESGFMIALKCLWQRMRLLLFFFNDLYNLREWQESQVSCLPFLSFYFLISTMNDFFSLSGKSSSISLKSSDTNSSFNTVDLFQCPFSENHWQQFVQLIGDIENRIDTSSFRELFWEETELSNKMQDSISSGWHWLSQLLELSF